MCKVVKGVRPRRRPGRGLDRGILKSSHFCTVLVGHRSIVDRLLSLPTSDSFRLAPASLQGSKRAIGANVCVEVQALALPAAQTAKNQLETRRGYE